MPENFLTLASINQIDTAKNWWCTPVANQNNSSFFSRLVQYNREYTREQPASAAGSAIYDQSTGTVTITGFESEMTLEQHHAAYNNWKTKLNEYIQEANKTIGRLENQAKNLKSRLQQAKGNNAIDEVHNIERKLQGVVDTYKIYVNLCNSSIEQWDERFKAGDFCAHEFTGNIQQMLEAFSDFAQAYIELVKAINLAIRSPNSRLPRRNDPAQGDSDKPRADPTENEPAQPKRLSMPPQPLLLTTPALHVTLDDVNCRFSAVPAPQSKQVPPQQQTVDPTNQTNSQNLFSTLRLLDSGRDPEETAEFLLNLRGSTANTKNGMFDPDRL
ncbi:hypothetical protein FIV00_26020 [Labrenzia sp. THAF82]|uniref:hypothetical protein n=1 Tax=Labrenzia sp. THAF82 TaxID=2587861 RepID=UPI001267C322|nr:hypothetical protein [Labrenzia sp. THAF82]QFT33980.1 hypothetical protein FIV00_26020 [Labrenzia sp. THAF82]